MSFGKMNQTITILNPTAVTDDEGFTSREMNTVATVRAYREGRHGSSVWANRAALTRATDLFRIRTLPGVDITEAMLIETAEGERFEIDSVEDIRGRGRYLEILATAVAPEGS
ncbi:MAG: head-tail adaptor protein [Mobiluncus sp.]|uniref:head-tail adaptor protein n=1 Tax=Mobiluncus sp. TaxID=47293 RepID=UPI0025851BEC|nr:head-tail adaptor protein [Mobiluncus sp.]MCI6585133.1 head-tail adaptor protein [Mobiluncus sp.]